MSIDVLVDKVLKLEDFREAEGALLSLKKREPKKAIELALDILKNKLGDVFFQACAFEVLYSSDRKKALLELKELLSAINVEVLRAVIESVAEDSELVEEEPQILEAVRLIKNKISVLDAGELETLESSINWFSESFNK